MEKPPGYITKLRAKNFRSLADVEISLEPLTIFVGLNASGKSNILDALRFLRDALTTTLQQAVDSRGGINALRRRSEGRPYDVSLEVHFQGPEWRAEYALTLGSKPGGAFRVKQERCDVHFRGEHAGFEIEKGKWVRRPDMPSPMFEMLKEYDASAPEALQEVVEQVPEHELFLPRAALLLGISAYTEAWNALRAMSFYALYPSAFREPAKPAMPYPLQDDGHNLASTLRSLRREERKSYERIVEFLGAAVPGVEGVTVKQVGGYLVVEVIHAMPSENAKGKRRAAFDLTQESDGTLRLLALFTALFQKPRRYVIGIEEPELNVHPGALPVLRDAVELASRESQILITTHSPELLSEFPPEVFRVVDLVDGVTHVGPMAEYQLEAVREHLFTAGELFVREGLRREGGYA